MHDRRDPSPPPSADDSIGRTAGTGVEHRQPPLALGDVSAAVLRVDGPGFRSLTPWPIGEERSDAPERGPWQFVARTGVSLDLDDLSHLAPDVAPRFDGTGVAALWCRPVWMAGRVAGVVVAMSPTPRRPDAAESAWLDSLVEVAARLFGAESAPVGALVDRLTGAATASRLQAAIDAELTNVAVLYLDLDGFDEVNAVYGTLGGDAVLIEVARRLDGMTRDADLVVRTASDEFVLVLDDAADLSSIQLAAGIIDELALPYEVAVHDDESVLVSVSASVGLCVQCDDTSFDVAVKAAYDALELAKSAGRDHLHVVSR